MYKDYIEARFDEINKRGKCHETDLPCTPAVKTLVEDAINLLDDNKPLEALVLLEAQTRLERKFLKDAGSIFNRLRHLNYGELVAFLAFGVGTLKTYWEVFINVPR